MSLSKRYKWARLVDGGIGDDPSPALQYMNLAWGYGNTAHGHSYTVLNKMLRDSLETAVVGGMPFDTGDIGFIYENMRGGYWFGGINGHSIGEWIYSLAIESRNASAYRSYEAWMNRKPFIVLGKRLAVGIEFDWYLDRLRVTSFAEDQSYVVACKYAHEQVDGYWREKLERVVKISHQDIREYQRRWKQSADTADDKDGG